MERMKEQFEKAGASDPVVVACFVLQCHDPRDLVSLLRQAFVRLQDHIPESSSLPQTSPSKPEPEDSWLSHSPAAEYLGVSKSTLYKYACQGKIECRKVGGRLDYRRSELERFKEKQIRPARHCERRSIIASAHSSGK